MSNMPKTISNLIMELADEEIIRTEVKALLDSGVDALDLITELNHTLNMVGARYETGELFLSELMMIGYLASELTAQLEPYLSKSDVKQRWKVVFGTVKGDIHDIGKNIVIMMLQSAGYEVIDLGIDVSPERFVEAVLEERPDVVCMSALLSSTMPEMEKVVKLLEKHGLRNDVKVVIGGRPVTREYAEKINVEGYADDAIKAVTTIKEILSEKGDLDE